jgi:hypothetical protein
MEQKEQQTTISWGGKELPAESQTTDLWLPTQEGTSVTGKVTEVFEGQYGPQHILEDEQGEIIRLPSHKMLQAKLEKARVGAIVRVTFLCEVPSKKGHPMRTYEVAIAN